MRRALATQALSASPGRAARAPQGTRAAPHGAFRFTSKAKDMPITETGWHCLIYQKKIQQEQRIPISCIFCQNYPKRDSIQYNPHPNTGQDGMKPGCAYSGQERRAVPTKWACVGEKVGREGRPTRRSETGAPGQSALGRYRRPPRPTQPGQSGRGGRLSFRPSTNPHTRKRLCPSA